MTIATHYFYLMNQLLSLSKFLQYIELYLRFVNKYPNAENDTYDIRMKRNNILAYMDYYKRQAFDINSYHEILKTAKEYYITRETLTNVIPVSSMRKFLITAKQLL